VAGNGNSPGLFERALAAPAGEAADDLAARREFEVLVAAHLPALRACASRLCRSQYDPDDVVQEALLRAFRTRSQVSEPQRMRSWLLTIVTRTFIDQTRKRRRRPEHVELVADAPAPEPVDPAPWDHIDPEDVRAAIDRLPDDVRDTYRMFAIEGLDYIAIAEAQQIPKATVGSRIFRARKRLRALLTTERGEGQE
jgi:RNA polymerase sigma-70 factor (ECF subfamily)